MLTKAKELLPLMKRIIEYSGSIYRQEDGSEEAGGDGAVEARICGPAGRNEPGRASAHPNGG